MIYLIYLILAVIVVLFSIKCANYVDLLDKKTKISGALIGGVILAAITSLPELITSISATVMLKKPDLVLGNVLGSNIFNLTVLAVIIIFTIKVFNNVKIGKSHFMTCLCTLIVYGVLTLLMLFNNIDFYILPTISVISIIILIVYIVSVKFMAADSSESEEKEDNNNLSIKQIIIRFVLSALGLIVSSIFITYATDIIAENLNLGASFAGAIFLGVATSLPELSSCIALAKSKNYNAMVGNILGSNMFNFFIITLTDIMFFDGSIFKLNSQTNSLIFFGLIATIATTFLISVKLKIKNNNKFKVVYLIPSLIVLICYILFIVFSI